MGVQLSSCLDMQGRITHELVLCICTLSHGCAAAVYTFRPLQRAVVHVVNSYVKQQRHLAAC